MDALHVAAAFSVGAEELITTEKKTKPMHKVVGIKGCTGCDNIHKLSPKYTVMAIANF